MNLSSTSMIRVLVPGGVLSPASLLSILAVAKLAGKRHVHLGSRQDIFLQVNRSSLPMVVGSLDASRIANVVHGRKKPKIQNMVSSYVSADLGPSTSWLTSGHYLHILEQFRDYQVLRVNIADPEQSLVPLFYGHLNFIASPVQDFWYLYVRRKEELVPEMWPVLIFGGDIPTVTGYLEKNRAMLRSLPLHDLFNLSLSELGYTWRSVEEPLKVPVVVPQEYEGFGKMYRSANYWAGFYWRNNRYDIPFLEELCELCLRTGVSKICLTPWKSLLIKDLQEKDLLLWHRLLGRYGINMRHSSFDLNWHLPLLDTRALRLKRYLVRKFDKVDICVHGLTFGIRTGNEPAFYTVCIDRVPGIRLFGRFELFVTYRVSHTHDFRSNACVYEEYLPQVPRYRLPDTLHSLTLKYYRQLTALPGKSGSSGRKAATDDAVVYQCSHCLTVYDEKQGDPLQRVLPGTAFSRLPESYACPLCDAPKKAFVPQLLRKLMKDTSL